MTANVTEEDREECQAAGMVDFVAKPFAVIDLRIVIGKWGETEQEEV